MWHKYHILQTSHIWHYGDDNDYYMLPVPYTNIKNVIICRNYVILSKGDYSLSNLTHAHRLTVCFLRYLMLIGKHRVTYSITI